MIPLRIVATLRGAIADRSKRLHIDALLMAAAATRDGLDPMPQSHRGPATIDIPLARSQCGRVFMCSQGISADEVHAQRWKNKRAPLAEMQMLGSKIKRINITGGLNRGYRIPLDTVHLRDDQIEWYAVGSRDQIDALLNGWVSHLGHRRAVGLGRVLRWLVEPCEPWGEGFPVLCKGRPMRPLPADWASVDPAAERAMLCFAPPYWRRAEEELCYVPAWT